MAKFLPGGGSGTKVCGVGSGVKVGDGGVTVGDDVTSDGVIPGVFVGANVGTRVAINVGVGWREGDAVGIGVCVGVGEGGEVLVGGIAVSARAPTSSSAEGLVPDGVCVGTGLA